MPKKINRSTELAPIVDKQVQKLVDIVSELDQAGQKIVIKGISSELTDAKKKALMSEVKDAALITDGKVKAWVVPAIAEVYVSSLNEQDKLLKKFGLNTDAGKITVEVLKGGVDMAQHLEAVNALVSNSYLDFGSSITGWVKGNEHILNDALRSQIQDKIATGRLTGDAVKDIKKEIVGALKNDGFQVLLDKRGAQWSLDRYSEMLARTHLVDANTQAAINRSVEFGVDLVEVSTHGATDFCSEFEGNVYSISGDSPDYPQLPDDPPFHPNCKHTLLPRPDLQL